MSLIKELAALFGRDLGRLAQHVDAFANDDALWRVLPGVTNSAGNLTLHIEGNLREYIGRQLGNISYQRTRDLEFSSKGIGKVELLRRLAELERVIPPVIGALTPQQLESEYPEMVLKVPMSTREFLIHLYGHLNWHRGQVDYLRRIMSV